MSPELGTTALAKVADSLLKELFESAKGIAKKSMGKFQAEFGLGFEAYIRRNQNKCRFVKTLLHRIDPIPIEQAYVEPTLLVDKKIIKGASFPEKLNDLKNVVVVGNGGSGKSMFLKKLFLELCEYPLGRIPLFIELRDINSREDKDLFQLMYHQWSELIPSFKLEALEAGFRSGKFFLLLDGLDEVDRLIREEFSKKIVALSYRFPLCPIVLTSRPISDFSAWQEFHVAEVQPFDLRQITELVEKTSIDGLVKTRFLKEVRERLFRSHQTFLANPLLCTMMVLTYTEFEDIPSKMHIFYARAFDVLFTRHDKTKTFFNRTFYSSLAEDDFKRLFSTFCLFSYLESTYSFEKSAAIRFVKLAIEFEGLNVDPNDFLSDLHESVSILVKDGDIYSFLHRSFQEYFAAVFLSERQAPKIDQIFSRVLTMSRGDNVLHLLFEMNRDALETKFLIRKVREFRNELTRLDPKTNLAGILSLMTYREVHIEGHAMHWKVGPRLALYGLISELYHFETELDPDEIEDDDWTKLHGYSEGWENLSKLGRPVRLMTSEIPNEILEKWPFAAKLSKAREEVIALDQRFKNKGESRGGFVASLLKRTR